MPKSKVKLPKVFRRRWLAMLRSGRYRQTQGSNRKTYAGQNAYCCLGVACRAAGVPAGKVAGASLTSFHSGYDYTGNGHTTLDRVTKTRGFIGLQTRLVTLNDQKKWSFKAIAGYIDKHTVGV